MCYKQTNTGLEFIFCQMGKECNSVLVEGIQSEKPTQGERLPSNSISDVQNLPGKEGSGLLEGRKAKYFVTDALSHVPISVFSGQELHERGCIFFQADIYM